MFTLPNILFVLLRALDMAASLYVYVLVIRALVSWFSPDPYNSLYRFLINITEPVLSRIRRFVPTPGIDFSPFIALLLIQFVVKGFIIQNLMRLVFSMGSGL